jgi:hypothetical protein
LLADARDIDAIGGLELRAVPAVRAATAAIRPALMHFFEVLDQGQKVRFAGMS